MPDQRVDVILFPILLFQAKGLNVLIVRQSDQTLHHQRMTTAFEEWPGIQNVLTKQSDVLKVHFT